MKKMKIYSEVAYVMGIVLMAVGNSLCAYGDWGMSMVVAPAYVLHLALVRVFPWFSFGVAEYTVQALVIMALIIMTRRIKVRFFLSFATTLIYGLFLDAFMVVTALLPPLLWLRILLYAVGVALGSAGVAVLFTAYFPPGLYEVLVQEIVGRWHGKLGVVKTVYDLCSLAVALLMSLLFFGALQGVGVGTVACAFVNGALIHLFGKWYARLFETKDALPWRAFFEGKK